MKCQLVFRTYFLCRAFVADIRNICPRIRERSPPPICATRNTKPEKARIKGSAIGLKRSKKVASRVPNPITVTGSIFSNPATATAPEIKRKEAENDKPSARK